MNNKHNCCEDYLISRRRFLGSGLLGFGLAAGMPLLFRRTGFALAADEALRGKNDFGDRILVVVELAGGNDGLNTLIPYANDVYYNARPSIAIRPEEVLRLDDEVGFHPQMAGFERLFKDGAMAIVPGCSYPNPNRSHFKAMEYWHTAKPNDWDERGWIGRYADERRPEGSDAFVVNLAREESLAVRSHNSPALVFDDPGEFRSRYAEEHAGQDIVRLAADVDATNAAQEFLQRIAATTRENSSVVREACRTYQTPVEYGAVSVERGLARSMVKVAALIAARFPARVYYVSLGGFDTHANQVSDQRTLLGYLSVALEGFVNDMERIGRGGDVAVMAFTEFGRRVEENASRGTDHGVATPVFVIGRGVAGGVHGAHPDLSDLDDGDVRMQVDFRSVYASLLKEWLGFPRTQAVLEGDFPTLGLFA